MSKARLLPILGALTLAAALAAGCSPARYIVAPPGEVLQERWPESRVTSHVVLVSVDGLRPDAIRRYGLPTLRRLMREGSYTLDARTILPSKTLPSHTSMLTGQLPDAHGVLWNTVVTADADTIEAPTIFGVARAYGFRTAAFFSKPKFQPLQRSGTLDYSQAPGGWFGGWSSERTVRDVAHRLETLRPNVLFVHLSDPDRAGHASGWMSPQYRRAVEKTDAALSRLLAAAEQVLGSGNYTLIVTADHGGHDFNHGSDDLRDVTIPWIAWGRGVTPGQLQDGSVHTTDTASTVLWLLGLTEPADWAGSPIMSAFRASSGAGGS